MPLKMNMRPVRLASTGRHLFEVPYSYQEKIEVDGITIEYVNREYLASAPLSPDQQTRLIEMIKKANEDQERAWDVNQPLDPKPETSK